MLGLIFSALRARRVPALVMFVLAGLTVAAVAGAGWADTRTGRDAGRARIAAATPVERTLSVRGSVALGPRPAEAMEQFRGLVGDVDAERVVLGARLAGALRAGERNQAAELRAVDDFCANVTLRQGRCATADGEVVLDAELARQLGVAVGGELVHRGGPGTAPVALTVTGVFDPVDPLGWYWSGQGGAAGYATLGTLAKAGGTVAATFDALLPMAAFDDAEALGAAVDRLRGGPLQVYSGAPALASAVAADRRGVHRGMLLLELQVVLFGALAVAVAAAYAAQERRADAARLTVRGLPRWRVLAATAGQSLVPLVAGTAWVLPWWPELWPALAAGALLVVAADWPAAIRAPAPELLREVQPRRPLAAATVEVCVLAVAAAAVFQVASEPAGDVRRDTGFGLAQVAPLLVALGAGVLATRALLAGAGLAGRTALAGGRVRGALAGLTLGRRRTAFRIVPVLAAATCLLALAAQDWAGAAAARERRATVEVGADRVLRIAPVPRERLLTAVRAADPDGRAAMAVVVTGPAAGTPVIAVDSPRLRAVTGLDLPALRAAAPDPIVFTGTRLSVRAAGGDATVRLVLVVPGTGEQVVAVFPPSTVDAVVPACGAGCRLAAVEVDRGPVDLLELRADGRVVVDGATFADPARWRTTLGEAVSTVQASQADGRLRLLDVQPVGDRPRDNRLYVVDTPVPLPALVAGELDGADEHDLPRVAMFSATVPVMPHPVATVPRGGAAGVLVDLADAARIVAAVGGGTPLAGNNERAEVWLSGSAPADIADRLRAAGLVVIGADSVGAATGRAGRLAPALTLRAGLAAGGLVLLLAAVAAAVVAAVDRRQRTAELLALRTQGLSAPAARTVGRWTALAPVLTAVPVGLLAAVGLRLLTPAPVRPFADRWPVAAPPVHWPAVLLAGAVAALVFGAVVLLRGRSPR